MADLGNTSVFSQTDASNGSGTMPSWLGSAAPSTLDDAGRALQGAVTREWNWRNVTLTAAGTADVKTLTYSVAPAAYYNGQQFAFIANTTNTTTVTLNVNSLGAKTIKKMVAGTATNLAAGDMISGAYVQVAYNTVGDYFVWTNFDMSTAVQVSAGNVGIGIAPSYKLHVNGSTVITDGTVNAMVVPLAGSSAALFGTLSNHDVVFYQNNAEAFRIDSSKNVLVKGAGGLGYGTGSGGTVTQATSKATGVTLNKTNGQITTAADALAAGADVSFLVTNSTIVTSDVVIVTILGSAGPNYRAEARNVGAGGGSVAIRITNLTAGSRSEAITINFAVIKAVTS